MNRDIVSLLSLMRHETVFQVIRPDHILSIVSGLFTNVTLSVFNFLPTNSTHSPNILYQVRGDKIIFTPLRGDRYGTHLKQDQLNYGC
jgi:hypothetical protein